MFCVKDGIFAQHNSFVVKKIKYLKMKFVNNVFCQDINLLSYSLWCSEIS